MLTYKIDIFIQWSVWIYKLFRKSNFWCYANYSGLKFATLMSLNRTNEPEQEPKTEREFLASTKTGTNPCFQFILLPNHPYVTEVA